MNASQVYNVLKELPESALNSVITALKDHINAKDNNGSTPLILACRYNNQNLALKLVENKADINARDSSNNTPLLWACYNVLESLALTLIEKEADLTAKDEMDKTAIDYIKERWSGGAKKIILEKIESIYKPVVLETKIAEQVEPKPVQAETKLAKSYPVGMLNITYLIENNITFTHENGQITLL